MDIFSKGKRIGGFLDALEFLNFLWICLRAFQNALVCSAGRIVTADDAGTFVNFLEKLYGRLKEIVHDSKVGINLIDPGLGLGGVIAIIAEDLSNLRTVLLFDVGVVVFFIRPGASELNFAVRRSEPAKAPEVVVNELRPIVGVDPFEGEGQTPFNCAHSLDDGCFRLAEHGFFLIPSGVNIYGIERVEKVTGGAGARVGDQIDFQKSRPMNVPEVSADGDHALEKQAGLGRAVETFFELIFLRSKTPIHLARADGKELSLGAWFDLEALAGKWNPIWERGFEPLGAQETCGSPDRVQDANRRDSITHDSSAGFWIANRFPIWSRPCKNSDGMFAVAL